VERQTLALIIIEIVEAIAIILLAFFLYKLYQQFIPPKEETTR